METPSKFQWRAVHRLIIPGYAQPKERARINTVVNFQTRTKKTLRKTPERTQAYEDYIRLLARTSYRGPVLEGPIRMDMVIRIRPPAKTSQVKMAACRAYQVLHPKRPDRSNIEKAVEDAVNGIIIKDDGQICAGEVMKYYHPDEGVTAVFSVPA